MLPFHIPEQDYTRGQREYQCLRKFEVHDQDRPHHEDQDQDSKIQGCHPLFLSVLLISPLKHVQCQDSQQEVKDVF